MFQIICVCFLFTFAFNLCLCFEEEWQEYQSSLRDANREELVITNLTTDEIFAINASVKKWTSLSMGPTCYSIGLMDAGLVILFSSLNTNNTLSHIKYEIKEFNRKPLNAILLQNRSFQAMEPILIVAFENDLKLEWYKIQETKLEPFWTWDLVLPVVHINAFSVNYKQVLLLASRYNKNSARVDLYQYQLKNGQKYWFWQSLDISNPIASSAFNYFEFDTYLSLPQKELDIVTVLKLEDNRFVPYRTIISKNVESVVSFEVGFQSFLAIDGLNAGIYQFKRHELEKEDIKNSNLDAIEFWLPIPVKTYRDEVILLAQRNINFESHNDYVIEIITYNGVEFEEHEDIPCTHFGEQTQLLSCLSEGNGVEGSSFLATGDKLGLIVPRPSNTPVLFNIHFEIKQISNPLQTELKDLLKAKEKLQKMIDQMRKNEEIQNISGTYEVVDESPHQILLSRQSQSISNSLEQQLEDIRKDIKDVKEKVDKIIERNNRTLYDVLTINGPVEIEEGKFKEVVVEKLGGEVATEFLEDIVRKDSIGQISGDKIANKINVSHVVFDKVNGIKANDIVFKNDSLVKLTGNVTVNGNAEVENVKVLTGQVNNVDLINEIVDTKNQFDGFLNFEKIKVNREFHVDIINEEASRSDQNNVSNTNTTELEQDYVKLQNLTVTNINGDDFDIFLKQLCLINIKCYIPGDLKINGNLTTEKGSISYLNNLKFPDEYVFRKSDGMSTTITGRKIFKSSVVAKEIKTHGKIDAIDTKKLVTLYTNQPEILGTITFKDIEVVDQLNVTGKIAGEHVDKFLPNPTLEVVKNISANVNFKKLEVDGNIIIENSFNHSHFEILLKDLIYTDEKEADILAQKIFPQGFTVKKNLEIDSNSINNISLDSIVTKDTDQILNITLLKGNVVIDDAEVEGKFNGENITQIEQDLVKLSGVQHVSSTFIFEEDLEVENLEVTQTLNNMTLEDYLSTDEDEEIDTDVKLQDIHVENVTVEGSFIGNISGFDIKDFSEKYLSYSKDQTIDKHYDIIYSTIDNLKAEHINNEKYEDLFNHIKISEKMKEKLNSGQVAVTDFYAKGPLYIETINEKNNSYWVPNNELRDFDGKFKKNITIEGNIFFKTLEIEKLSDVKWNWFNKKLIRKDEVDTVILAPYKNFKRGIKVAKLIETKKINGIPIENILTKQGQQTLNGPVTIKGNVVFKENVNITENLNEIPVGKILNNLDIENGTYTIKGNMFFKRVPHIYNLDINGSINNKNTTEYLSHVVRLDEDSVFYEEFAFKEPVSIAGNLAIEEGINGIDLAEVGSQIVLTTRDTQIQGLVTFAQSVVIKNKLTVDGGLNAATLFGIDLDEWKNNSVYLDKGMVEGIYEFDKVIIKDSLRINKLNGINMDTIIPLKSDQTIDHLEFGEVTATKDISVFGSVNNYSNLSNEFEITVMNDKDQKINSNVIFNNVILVRENLSTNSINGIDATKIVTTDTDQNLTSPFSFKAQCKIDSDIYVHGLVNGINTTLWKNGIVKIYMPQIQKLYNDWKVVSNMTFFGDIGGGSLINDLNLTSVMREVETRKNYKLTVEHGIIEDYKHMCVDVSYLYQVLKKQIYKFKYFEELHTITFTSQIQYVFYFQFRSSHYLLVNDINCTSQLLVFKTTAFEPLSTMKMGHISQAITVQGNNSLYLVTRDANLRKKCEVGGTNVWSFNEDTLELHYKIEELALLQESMIPYTFYGLNNGNKKGVVEYNVAFSVPRKCREWSVSEENAAFVPRGLNTGLSLRTGHKIIFLDRSDPIEKDFSEDTEFVIKGNTSEVTNFFIPGRDGGDLVVTEVGIKSARRNLLAVATHEETSVKGRLDFIKIYSDAVKGDIFHKVPAYKPSSLLSVEFGQGETLLVFMENGNILQVYEYKGIQGFQHLTSARVEGSKLFLMTLPIEPYLNPRKAIGIVHKNRISIIHSIMAGNKIRDDFKCGL